MDIWNKKLYCQDLKKFSDVIQKLDQSSVLSGSISSLYGLAQVYEYEDDTKIESPEIVFEIKEKIAGTIPSGVSAITIHFSCSYVFNQDIDDRTKNDPFEEYSFQVEIIGKTNGDCDPKNYWHLDRDIKPDESGIQKVEHPLYHFQSGGHGMDNLESTGDVLILTAPRIPHPPMDIFLGVHFILSNFVSKKDYPFLTDLFEDIDYQDILERARMRMFAPYFSAYSNFAANGPHNDFTLNKVFPAAASL